MIKILHLSDTHFHHLDENNASLQERFKFINDHYPDHYRIITGDISDDGMGEQYDKARVFIGDADILCPGNHDYGVIGSFYTEKAAKRFDLFSGADFFLKKPVTYIIGNVLLIGLNSCLKTEDPFDFGCGEIGKAQLNLLRAVLDDKMYSGMVKIVMLHHHPFIHSDPIMMLFDGIYLMRTIYEKVDILMFGHKHEQAQWINKSGCKFILASGALFNLNTVKEIVVDGNNIAVTEVKII